MTRFAFAMRAVALVTPWLAAAAQAPSAAGVAAEIDSIGAKQTIAKLNQGGDWNSVVSKIGTGGATWVSLAERLAPGSDAGSAEDLGIALAYALPHNPAAVLAVIDPDPNGVLGVHRVCGMPFIEMPKTKLAGYLKQTSTAVTRVKVPALLKKRDACLAALKS